MQHNLFFPSSPLFISEPLGIILWPLVKNHWTKCPDFIRLLKEIPSWPQKPKFLVTYCNVSPLNGPLTFICIYILNEKNFVCNKVSSWSIGTFKETIEAFLPPACCLSLTFPPFSFCPLWCSRANSRWGRPQTWGGLCLSLQWMPKQPRGNHSPRREP